MAHDSYSGEARGRFPHLYDGSNRGVKPKRPEKVGKVMHEYKEGELHSGSKEGPVVRSRKQAVAIAMSEAGMSRKKKHSSHMEKY